MNPNTVIAVLKARQAAFEHVSFELLGALIATHPEREQLEQKLKALRGSTAGSLAARTVNDVCDMLAAVIAHHAPTSAPG